MEISFNIFVYTVDRIIRIPNPPPMINHDVPEGESKIVFSEMMSRKENNLFRDLKRTYQEYTEKCLLNVFILRIIYDLASSLIGVNESDEECPSQWMTGSMDYEQ